MTFLRNLFRPTQPGPQAPTTQSSSTTTPTSQSQDAEYFRTLLSSLLGEIVGDIDVGDWEVKVDTRSGGRLKFELVTEDQTVEIAWTYVQDLWNKMLEDLKV
jgi:hypothetical protein